MFGCGKFNEERFLLFIDGKIDLEIENHLKTCKTCLKEFIELNRINSEIENFKLKPNNVILVKSLGEKLVSYFTTFEKQKIAVSGVMGEEKRKENLIVEFLSFLIKILKNGKYFTLSISNRDKQKFDIELRKIDEEIPFYIKTNSDEETTISNLKGENYILKINDKEIILNLTDEEQDEN